MRTWRVGTSAGDGVARPSEKPWCEVLEEMGGREMPEEEPGKLLTCVTEEPG